MDEEEKSIFHIPSSTLALENERAYIEELAATPTTPAVIERAFPYNSKEAHDLKIYKELSAVSDEVMACRESILGNIF